MSALVVVAHVVIGQLAHDEYHVDCCHHLRIVLLLFEISRLLQLLRYGLITLSDDPEVVDSL